MKDAMEEDQPSKESLMEKGHPRRAAESAVSGIELYKNIDIVPYKKGLKKAITGQSLVAMMMPKIEKSPS